MFKTQLASGKAEFFWTQGSTPVTPPAEFEGFFGPPPHYTFSALDDPQLVKFNIRDFPKRDTPEATMKKVLDTAGQPTWSNISTVVDELIRLMEEEGGIEGVIGYSEGAEIAASLILEEARRKRKTGREPLLKCAVLICGWPPMDPVSGKIVLADEEFDGEMITIPTCHIVGAADPFLDAAMALYNLCDPDSADLFDHGGGHVIPSGRDTLTDITGVVRNMIVSVAG
ncbi:hypothetical protein N7492_003815 [Penicillium capsulatum]|uniref:Serine hydrolase domain-containing protein n=1 Tax=Penicillium capsulatum TaxID=69766 RepID=A0A9W9IL98_9EURO|nr:hypothetical protein N7492_003815 [Penicillium capsulatum]